jgi:rRNA maturation protein Nop10
MSSRVNIYNLEEIYSECGDKNRAKRPKNFDITDKREGKIRLKHYLRQLS